MLLLIKKYINFESINPSIKYLSISAFFTGIALGYFFTVIVITQKLNGYSESIIGLITASFSLGLVASGFFVTKILVFVSKMAFFDVKICFCNKKLFLDKNICFCIETRLFLMHKHMFLNSKTFFKYKNICFCNNKSFFIMYICVFVVKKAFLADMFSY